jgi:hypothetical protein
MNLRRYYRSFSRHGLKLPRLTFLLFLCILFALNASAFKTSLQPEEVEDAYSLGQSSNHEEIRNFLSQYEHDFKYPSENSIAFVQSVEFQTPYEQIVLRSQKTIQYSKFRASEDYQANPTLVIVRAVVSLKRGYSGPTPPADSFKVSVSQANGISPRNVTSNVLCDPSNYADTPTVVDCLAYTREILLQFDGSQFAHGNATVRVTLPYGQPMETKFNLDKLK